MRSSQFQNRFLILLTLTISSLFIIRCNNSDVNFDEAEQVLTKIADYRYGQTLEPMVRFDEILRHAKNESSIARIEQMMLNRLNSNCTVDGKDQICRRLRYIGSEKSAPLLLEMLNDSATFEISLYALEMIPGSEVDDLLYQEFMNRTGPQKIRLINIIGIRSIETAIPELEKLLYSTENDIAAAVITAIGQMPADKSIKIFLPAIDKTTGDLQLRVLNAVIQAAEKLDDKNQSKSAYLKVYQNNYPVTTRLSALQHIINFDPETGTDIVVKVISSDDIDLRTGVFALIHLIPDGKGLNQIIANSSQYNTREMVILIQALSNKTESNYSDFFLDCAGSNNTTIRIAGLYALRYSKAVSVVPYLISTAATATGNEKSTARESLYLMNVQEVDNLILKLLEESESREKIEVILCIGERQIKGSTSRLVAVATDNDIKVSRTAIRSLKFVSEIQDIDILTELLLKVDDPVRQKEIVTIIQGLVVQVEPIDTRATGIIKSIASISDKNQKIQLLQVMGASGNPQALPVLSSALRQSDEELEKGAIKALSLWPDEKPADTLLARTKITDSEPNRILAFRGYLTLLARSENISDTDLLVRYKEAIEIAPNTNEKKKVFSGIASLEVYAAIELAANYLNDANLKPEAEAAIIDVSWKVYKEADVEKIKNILQSVIDKTKNNSIRKDALELIDHLN